MNLGQVLTFRRSTGGGTLGMNFAARMHFSNNDYRDLCWQLLELQFRVRKSKNGENRGEFVFFLCPYSVIKGP